MKYKPLVFGTLVAVLLYGGVSSPLASGFGTCEVKATVLCNHGMEQSGDGAALKLRFRVVDSPLCRGIARIETDQVIEAVVMPREGEELPAVRRGTRLRLQYDYFEGLGPEGLITSHRWILGPDH